MRRGKGCLVSAGMCVHGVCSSLIKAEAYVLNQILSITLNVHHYQIQPVQYTNNPFFFCQTATQTLPSTTLLNLPLPLTIVLPLSTTTSSSTSSSSNESDATLSGENPDRGSILSSETGAA